MVLGDFHAGAVLTAVYPRVVCAASPAVVVLVNIDGGFGLCKKHVGTKPGSSTDDDKTLGSRVTAPIAAVHQERNPARNSPLKPQDAVFTKTKHEMPRVN